MNGRAMLYRIEWRLMQWWGAALADVTNQWDQWERVPLYKKSVFSVGILVPAEEHVRVLAKATEHVRRIRFALPEPVDPLWNAKLYIPEAWI